MGATAPRLSDWHWMILEDFPSSSPIKSDLMGAMALAGGIWLEVRGSSSNGLLC